MLLLIPIPAADSEADLCDVLRLKRDVYEATNLSDLAFNKNRIFELAAIAKSDIAREVAHAGLLLIVKE